MTTQPPNTITAIQTAVFKLCSPSARKRAAMLDAKRTHLATAAKVRKREAA